MDVSFILLQTTYLFLFGCVIYIFILADPDESPMANLFQQRIPSFLMNHLIRKYFGDEIANAMGTIHYLQVLYLAVVLGCWSIMFAHGYPLIEESTQVSSYHMYSGYVAFVLCMGSWRYACRVPPGFITEHSIPKFDNYPYDNLLYTPNKICPTMNIRKLARSKYDRFSKCHVARFDHFCGWLNQAVGEENYRYFLFFLIVHTVMCTYGSVVTALLFYGEIVDKDLWNATFYNAVTGAEVKATKSVVFQYLITTHYYLARVLLVMVVVAIALCGFLGFHLYITARGMTTNEYFKWKEVRMWHRKYKMKYEKALKEGRVVVEVTGECGEESDRGNDKAGNKGPMIASNSLLLTDDNEQEEEIIDPGPFPRNMYDVGIIENFKEIIHPRSLRQDALKRYEDWIIAERRRIVGRHPKSKKS